MFDYDIKGCMDTSTQMNIYYYMYGVKVTLTKYEDGAKQMTDNKIIKYNYHYTLLGCFYLVFSVRLNIELDFF